MRTDTPTALKPRRRTPAEGQLHCLRCEYQWYPRIPNQIPAVCPRCKSYQWQTKSSRAS